MVLSEEQKEKCAGRLQRPRRITYSLYLYCNSSSLSVYWLLIRL